MPAEKILPTQGRDAPAYQEFAASMIARVAYRQMSLAERGLLYTLRNECWVNRDMPSDPSKLARVLGQPADEVIAALPGVMEFFEVRGNVLICPELERYRAYLEARRARMSEGGKKSAEKRKRSRHPAETDSANLSTLQAPSRDLPRGLQALRQDKSKPEKQNPVSSMGDVDDPWIRDFEQEETSAMEYARQSRGG